MKPYRKATAIAKLDFYNARYKVLFGDYSNSDIDTVLAHAKKTKRVLRAELNLIRKYAVDYKNKLKPKRYKRKVITNG